MLQASMKSSFSKVFILTGTIGQALLGQTLPDSSAASPHLAGSSAASPRIQFASSVFDFVKVSQGELVRHDFVFTNTGLATLEISSVRPGCGCTSAGNWDKRIEPGHTGVIPLQLNSAGFSGEIVKRTVVVCNDPVQTNIVLEMTGTVWKAFEITPASVVFSVLRREQTNQTKLVKIVSQLEAPVKLWELESTDAAFQGELKTVKPGKEFELLITALPPFGPAARASTLTLKTSSPDAPRIKVKAQVVVVEPMVVSPERITLPEGPLPPGRKSMVVIRNNETNLLTLTDARISSPEASVQIHETQPGRLFVVSVQFPPGFELTSDDEVELTLRSNHPDYALIRVPVIRSSRAAGRAAAIPATTSARTVPASGATP
jgi:Protein of unknown function (DUF1573)